jgi:sugar phosphate isomerase/epimerase
MWTVSGFADEISADLNEQCHHLGLLGVRFLELRSAWDINVSAFTSGDLARVAPILDLHSIGVSAIGSPVGKVYLDEDFGLDLNRLERAIEVAHQFSARFIRVFSYFLREDQNPSQVRDHVLRRMAVLTSLAEQNDLTLLHENEKGIYGDVPSRCLDLIESIGSSHLQATWDPANFVQVGVRPYDDAFLILRPYLKYLQIKDALADTGRVAGAGDGQVRETVRALHADGFDGFFSLEPHLESAHSGGGFSGPEFFGDAYRAFTGILKQEGIAYS